MIDHDEPNSGNLFHEVNRNISQEMAALMDSRMQWTLMPSPIPIIFIVLVYLYLIYIILPNFMKTRQPYSLKTFIQCYNILQVIANFWLVFNILTHGCRPFAALWMCRNSFPEVYGQNTKSHLESLWWILLLKILDLSETIMFILRKKYQQVSLLHVYHHATTVLYGWIIFKYFLHSHILFLFMLNGTVHAIMYSYYFLSTCGPKVQKKISIFKQWITVIQIVQLVLGTLIAVKDLITDCEENERYFGIITVLLGITNISFFWNFYAQSYQKSKSK